MVKLMYCEFCGEELDDEEEDDAMMALCDQCSKETLI